MTSLEGILRALGPVEFDDINRLFIASSMLVAIGKGLHPREVLQCLADSFDDQDWESIKEAVLMQQFEDQMGAAARAPI